MYKELEGLVMEKPGDSHGTNAKPEAARAPWQPRSKVETHFADGLVGNFHLQKPRTWVDIFVSVLGHSVLVAILILLPLYFTQAINLQQYQNTFLAAPPPPGAAMGGVVGGVPGGVPGGQLGGVLGGILGGSGKAPAPPPPGAHKGPYRVGGKVQAPRLIEKVQPVYPPLAKQARVQGAVVIESVIDTQGKVTQMKVVSGSPLLVHAAMQALEQWRYQPTLLNGEPIAVDMLVTVTFELGQDS